MRLHVRQFRKWSVGLVLGIVFTTLLSGCDDSRYDYSPPPGMGALIVDNFTGDRVLVYIDGEEAESVSSGGQRIYDRLPGVHRVALDSDSLRRSWADDVDMLEGRRTVMELRGSTDDLDVFDVRLYFD